MKSGKRKWAAVGARVRGAMHIKNNVPCQDAIAIQNTDKYSIVAISDGHGSSSCPHSDEGANIAVQTAITIFGDIFNKPDPLNTLVANKDVWLPKQIEQHWKSNIYENHGQQGRAENNFSYELYGATLIVVVAAFNFIFALQIGDGDILTVEEKSTEWLIAPDEILGPETNSLCQDECWQYMRTRTIPLENLETMDENENLPMLLICTDGYTNSFYRDKDFIKAGSDFYSLVQKDGLDYVVANLEDWLNVSSQKGSGDDISLAIIVRTLAE
ncbi:MAG: protein phosphatase 2C domain-containing protein [Defluviitaleaceae bacterium]|nr:protein phosphatase 2C domain-containing protein [Defluviitaleaceae bacterium]